MEHHVRNRMCFLAAFGLLIGTGACGGNDDPDSQNPNPDAGVNADAGENEDEDGGQQTLGPPCTGDGDCLDVGDQCLAPTGAPCNGAADCTCATPCNANAANTGCDADEVCQWLPGLPIEGACIPDSGGAPHNTGCTAGFDVNGLYLGDTCAVNHYCWGATPNVPTGVCSRFCPPNDTTVCLGLGNYACDTTVSQDGSLGLCLAPIPNFTDIGAPCTDGTGCQGGRCFTEEELGVQSCSSSCEGLGQCPVGTVCAPFGPPLGDVCMLDCTAGGTAVCSAKNPNYTCHQFGAPNTPLGLCFPNCGQVQNQCFAQQRVCDAVTGECS